MFCPACIFTFFVVVCESANVFTCNCSSNVSHENALGVPVDYETKYWSLRNQELGTLVHVTLTYSLAYFLACTILTLLCMFVGISYASICISNF